MGPSKVGNASTHLGYGRPLGRFSVGLASRSCFASLLRGIRHTWPNYCNVAMISQIGEVFRHSVLCEFHSCALCHEVSHQGLNPRVRGHITSGAELLGRPKVLTMSQVLFSMQCIILKTPLFRTCGAKSASCPGRHLISVRPCVTPWTLRKNPIFGACT